MNFLKWELGGAGQSTICPHPICTPALENYKFCFIATICGKLLLGGQPLLAVIYQQLPLTIPSQGIFISSIKFNSFCV